MLSTICGYDVSGTIGVGTANEVGTIDTVGADGEVLGCDASPSANASARSCTCGVTSGCDHARAAFIACLEHGPWLDMLAQASKEADDAYACKKPPKGKPWPREHYLREIKRIRPAKIAVAGPDFAGATACLQELSGLGYVVEHREVEAAASRVFVVDRFRAL